MAESQTLEKQSLENLALRISLENPLAKSLTVRQKLHKIVGQKKIIEKKNHAKSVTSDIRRKHPMCNSKY